jgi:hypothetical protein
VTKRKSSTVGRPWLQDYATGLAMKDVPVPNTTLIRLGEELLTWAEHDEEALTISKFFSKHKISYSTLFHWKKRCPELDESYHIAKELIGVRREEGALKGKYKENTVIKTLGIYSQEFRDDENRKAQITKDINQGSATQVVLVPDFGSTDVVPPLE